MRTALRVARVAALAVALGAPGVEASRLPFRLYQTGDGLPQSQVLALHQARDGEIWVGTWCGAAYYDGAQFRYLTQRSGLPSNYVRGIVEDTAGDLWLAVGNGVARVAAGDRARPAEVVDPLIPRPRPSAVRDVLVDSHGVLWALSQSDGVAYRDGSRFVAIEVPETFTDGLQLLAEQPAGTVLVGTSRGLFAIERGAARPWRAGPGPWTEPIRLVYAAAPDQVVFATAAGVFLAAGASLTELKTIENRAITLGRVARRDRSGRLWVGTDSGVYQQVDMGFARVGTDEGLPNERLYSILEDREGDLWFGTDGGLARLAGEAFRVFGATSGGPGSPVWSLGLDGVGVILAGTADGASRFDGRAFVPMATPGSSPLRGKTVRCVVTDSSGKPWFGTADDGLYHWDGRAWHQWLPPQIPDARVFSAFRDGRGDLWFGTRRGLVRLRGTTVDTWARRDGLPDDTVWQVTQDPNGHVVIATDGGVAVFDGTKFGVPARFARFARVAVRSVLFGRDGSVWVGTNGAGLGRLRNGTWSDLFAGDGPSDDFTWGLVEDARGRLWVATNRGVDLFDGRRWVNFSARDGMPDNEIAVNAAVALADGSVWLGFVSPPAVVRFSPSVLVEQSLAPVVKVTGVASPKRSVSGQARLVLPWNERDLTFSYIGISFRDERRVRYRTRLLGYEADFGRETPLRSVRYTNLPAGRYRFEVLAASAGGAWSPAPATLEIEILAPFWRRPWFAGLAMLAVLGLLVLGARLRVAGLTRNTARLESLVAERTRALQEHAAESERLRRQFEQLSVTDPLTGISNRRFFMEQLEREVIRARRHHEGLGLLLIDLDHFKQVNDRFGHPVGDQVLSAVARALSGSIRRTDLLARYGGEEFVIAFVNTTRAGCLEHSEEMRRQVGGLVVRADGERVSVTFSAGLAWHDFGAPDGELSLEELIRRADRELYRAKANGRNRIETAE